MPFAITCPACQHKFRTAKQRELGKGVQCAKCGEQFYVSEENQTEVSGPRNGPPLVPVLPKKKQLRTRPRDHEWEEPDSDRRQDHRHDSKPKGRAGKLLLIVAMLGIGLLIAGGGGVYYFFFRSGAANVEPKKDLPLDLLVFSPAERSSVFYYDLVALRQKNAVPATFAGRIATRLPAKSGITPNELDAYCESGAQTRGEFYSITSLRFSAPRAVEDVAKNCGFTAQDVEGTTCYIGPHKKGQAAVFQAGPNRLVFVESSRPKDFDNSVLAELIQRPTSSFSLAGDIMACLEEVSGYPVISVSDVGNNVGGVWRVQVVGRKATDEESVRELRVRSFDTEEDATARRKKNRGKTPSGASMGYSTWQKGRLTFELMTRPGQLS